MEQQMAEILQQVQQLMTNQTQFMGQIHDLRTENECLRAERRSGGSSSSRVPLINTRMLIKPCTFDGSDEKWSGFAFMLRPYLGA